LIPTILSSYFVFQDRLYPESLLLEEGELFWIVNDCASKEALTGSFIPIKLKTGNCCFFVSNDKTSHTKMEAFKGKYERTSAEKYEDFLKALGVNMLLRKAATVSTPSLEISEEGGDWVIKTSTTLKSMELKFKVCFFQYFFHATQ